MLGRLKTLNLLAGQRRSYLQLATTVASSGALCALLVASACVSLDRPRVLDFQNAQDAGPDGPVLGDAPDGASGDVAEGPVDAPVFHADGAPGDAGGDAAPPPRAALGRPCERGEQCVSGFCAQGVCCESGCSGTCMACNLSGGEGACRPVPAGEDPLADCDQDPAGSCARDGTCDGAGQCRRYMAGTECAPGSCVGATEIAASVCDGAGSCLAGSSRACQMGVCIGASCGSTCADASQCQAGFFCKDSECQVKRPMGQACAVDGECATGFCSDGVCCGSRCATFCFGCNLPGSVGTCVAAPGGQDPRGECPAQAPTTCGRAGGCNGAGACALFPAGTVCGGATCSAATETPAATCDGLSVCRPGTPRACTPYGCGATACATTCSNPTECVPEYTCVGEACVRIPGLVLIWRFEDAAGTPALDGSGNGFHGTLVGASGLPASSTLVPALSYANTRSLAFVQANRHAVTLPTIPAALRPANNLTVSVFFRSTKVDVNGATPVGAELVSGGNNYILRLRAGGDVEFSKHPATGSSVQCRAPAPGSLDGNWHHVAAVASATTGVEVYFDGARICTVSNTENISYDAGIGFWVGRHGGTETQWDFDGNIDEVRVYNRALSAAEVTVLAQGGK